MEIVLSSLVASILLMSSKISREFGKVVTLFYQVTMRAVISLGALIVCGLFTDSWAATCAGRCGTSLDSSYTCQCNTACERFGDCCTDYYTRCFGATCAGRCGTSLDTSYTCQCNTACERFGDCCTDYCSICIGDPLSCAMQDIWNSDVNRFPSSDIVTNANGYRYFTRVNETRLSGPTYAAFINLLDNYERNIGTPEILLETSVQEINTFLNVVLATEVMTITYNLLKINGIVSDTANFRSLMKELWFNLYPRSSSNVIFDSSGFEHAMVGELKGTSTVSGFHSWIQFYLQEKAGHLSFQSEMKVVEPSMRGIKFTWYGQTKTLGSFFLGTSPEFDLAVYSICALLHTNSQCNFDMQGHSVSIRTWDIGHKYGNQIGSAYPSI